MSIRPSIKRISKLFQKSTPLDSKEPNIYTKMGVRNVGNIDNGFTVIEDIQTSRVGIMYVHNMEPRLVLDPNYLSIELQGSEGRAIVTGPNGCGVVGISHRNPQIIIPYIFQSIKYNKETKTYTVQIHDGMVIDYDLNGDAAGRAYSMDDNEVGDQIVDPETIVTTTQPDNGLRVFNYRCESALGIIDDTNNIKVKPAYDTIQLFTKVGRAIVSNKLGYGVIDILHDEIIIPCVHTHITSGDNGLTFKVSDWGRDARIYNGDGEYVDNTLEFDRLINESIEKHNMVDKFTREAIMEVGDWVVDKVIKDWVIHMLRLGETKRYIAPTDLYYKLSHVCENDIHECSLFSKSLVDHWISTFNEQVTPKTMPTIHRLDPLRVDENNYKLKPWCNVDNIYDAMEIITLSLGRVFEKYPTVRGELVTISGLVHLEIIHDNSNDKESIDEH